MLVAGADFVWEKYCWLDVAKMKRTEWFAILYTTLFSPDQEQEIEDPDAEIENEKKDEQLR